MSPGRRGLPRHYQAVCVCISQGDWIAKQLLWNPYFWEGSPGSLQSAGRGCPGSWDACAQATVLVLAVRPWGVPPMLPSPGNRLRWVPPPCLCPCRCPARQAPPTVTEWGVGGGGWVSEVGRAEGPAQLHPRPRAQLQQCPGRTDGRGPQGSWGWAGLFMAPKAHRSTAQGRCTRTEVHTRAQTVMLVHTGTCTWTCVALMHMQVAGTGSYMSSLPPHVPVKQVLGSSCSKAPPPLNPPCVRTPSASSWAVPTSTGSSAVLMALGTQSCRRSWPGAWGVEAGELSLAQGSGLTLTGVLVAGGRGRCCWPGAPYSTCI